MVSVWIENVWRYLLLTRFTDILDVALMAFLLYKLLTLLKTTSGTMKSQKGVNIPGARLNMPFLSERDKSDLLFGIEQNVDYVAASFTRRAQDIIDMRSFLNSHGGEGIRIIAKIENTEGVEKFDEILAASDGIMVARGDMGVEIPFERLPGIQKHFIRSCCQAGPRQAHRTAWKKTAARPVRKFPT